MTEIRAPYATAQAAGHPLTLTDFTSTELCAEIVELRAISADLRERVQELEQENIQLRREREALARSSDYFGTKLIKADKDVNKLLEEMLDLRHSLRQIAGLKLHHHEGRCEARRIIDEALK